MLLLSWMVMVDGVKKEKRKKLRSFKRSRDSKKIVKGSIKLKLPILTFYVFSSENWKRPKGEISFYSN